MKKPLPDGKMELKNLPIILQQRAGRPEGIFFVFSMVSGGKKGILVLTLNEVKNEIPHIRSG